MKNRIALLFIAALAGTVAACDTDLAFAPTTPDTFVVQAFLFAGEPVTEVTVTGVLPIDADSTATAAPIADARIAITRDGARFDLVPTEGEPGRYHYPGSDLLVEVGDVFGLEASHGDRTATAETVVPVPPHGLSLSATVMAPPEFGVRGGGFQPGADEGLVARWENSASALHYVVVDNIEAEPAPFAESPFGGGFARRFVQRPTAGDSALVSARSLSYFGRHRVRLYRVNEEYADLYEGLNQDSRDLNEPPSNVRGALGVFSAFSADSAFFEVR
ncbi:MAG: hypothetical protein OXE73_00900 [Gammaproteobacteria bacterium]|nr:hypothetical protein [Gammaproteobacteria bacterium]